jgi:hypothetical protein
LALGLGDVLSIRTRLGSVATKARATRCWNESRAPLGNIAFVWPIGLGFAALVRPADINVSHARDLAGETDVAALEGTANEMLGAAFAAGVREAVEARCDTYVPININGDG